MPRCGSTLLKIAPLDVIALQDGIGTGGPPDPRHCTVETIPDWLAPMSNAIRNIRPTTELWADVELYDEVVNDRRPPVWIESGNNLLPRRNTFQR